MINREKVTACLVTRGDQPEMMARIQQSLIFADVIVWDNSAGQDEKCAGRYWACAQAKTPFVYFQDDDVIVPPETQVQLCLEHTTEMICTANWGHGETPAGYDDLPLVCGGAIVNAEAPWAAIRRYVDHWPMDDEFRYEADFVVGALYPRFRHVFLPFDIDLSIAQHPSRLCNQPWQRDMKQKITERARAIRDGQHD
jgi:hypothetical protein